MSSMVTSSHWSCRTLQRPDLPVIDAHSKWLEVHPMPTITAQAIMQHPRTIFAKFGLPERVVSNNGQPSSAGNLRISCVRIGLSMWCLLCTIQLLMVGGKSSMDFQRRGKEIEERWHADETNKTFVWLSYNTAKYNRSLASWTTNGKKTEIHCIPYTW